MSVRPTRRAWLIVAGGFITFTVSASLMHAYTVFLLAFIADFAWTRAEASLAYSVGQVVGGASAEHGRPLLYYRGGYTEPDTL